MEYVILAVGVGLLIAIVFRLKNRKKSVETTDTSDNYVTPPRTPNHDALNLFPGLKNIIKNKENEKE